MKNHFVIKIFNYHNHQAPYNCKLVISVKKNVDYCFFNFLGVTELSLNWKLLPKLWKPDTFFINGKKSKLHKITVRINWYKFFKKLLDDIQDVEGSNSDILNLHEQSIFLWFWISFDTLKSWHYMAIMHKSKSKNNISRFVPFESLVWKRKCSCHFCDFLRSILRFSQKKVSCSCLLRNKATVFVTLF